MHLANLRKHLENFYIDFPNLDNCQEYIDINSDEVVLDGTYDFHTMIEIVQVMTKLQKSELEEAENYLKTNLTDSCLAKIKNLCQTPKDLILAKDILISLGLWEN